MLTYEKYCADCKAKGFEPSMTPEQIEKMNYESMVELEMVRKQNTSLSVASLDVHISEEKVRSIVAQKKTTQSNEVKKKAGRPKSDTTMSNKERCRQYYLNNKESVMNRVKLYREANKEAMNAAQAIKQRRYRARKKLERELNDSR